MTILLLGILVSAVITDLRTYRIPNFLILSGLLSGLLQVTLTEGLMALHTAIVNASIICVSLLLLYFIKALGAGDVKLFSVIAVFVGLKPTYRILLCSLVIGGALGLIKVVVKTIQKKKNEKKGGKRNKNRQFNEYAPTKIIWTNFKGKGKMTRMHFSIPISIATLLITGGII